jgi:DNA (cytosine-5)-methyltransferase 1
LQAYNHFLKKFKHIELFAGCGGLSLGLDAAGFELFFANELSPMAGETFAYNLLHEDLKTKAEDLKPGEKVLWIKSQYPKTNLKERLRENPFEAIKGSNTDIDLETDLNGKLLIGDIVQLLELLQGNPKLLKSIQKKKIDVLSGGPPCQGFSLAGKREKNDHKNLLPLSFAKISGLIKPKVVLLENVKGITSPFTENDVKYYAWLEVSKAFALEGFVPICMLLNSKYFGVAQNRPRFILIAYRKDIFNKIKKRYSTNTIVKTSDTFYNKVIKAKDSLENIKSPDFKYYDIEKNPELFDGNLLPKITTTKEKFVSAMDAIGDIRRTNIKYYGSKIKSGYGSYLNEIFQYTGVPDYEIRNHDVRDHDFGVKARFRFYQVINEFQNGLKKSAVDLFSGKDLSKETLEKLFREFSNYNLFFQNGNNEVYKKPNDLNEVEALVKSIPSKKHTQRALLEYEPAPAQLTIPDDICHYHMENLRTMTVREMARFQSFPDWFEFRSKVTTGGQYRKYEVPQYTQVGNAVPPLLAKTIGECISGILKKIDS